jgi:hypothetical protein
MSKLCIVCKAGASPDLQLQYCANCQSALYCSKACQRNDWKNQHKKICKIINVGHGDLQVRDDVHTERAIMFKQQFEDEHNSLEGGGRRFYKAREIEK